MTQSASPAKTRTLGPHSRVLVRGAVGDVSGRSREGRFLRMAERELLAQIGGEPAFAQRLLVRRVARAMLQLEKLDERLATDGELSSHAGRAYSALSNVVRLGLREIGMKAAAKNKSPSLSEYLASKGARKDAAPSA